jgi:protein SCO1/2
MLRSAPILILSLVWALVASAGLASGDATAHADRHAHPVALPADAPLPGASLYHLDDAWTDHRGAPFTLGELRGGPVLVTMIYASCETACPVLVRDLARTYEALPAEARQHARVLVVSFDPERDAPERLAAYVAASGLEHPAWRFAVGEAHATRALAALLGVRYRPSGEGMFSHTNLIAVLDADGQVAHRVEGLGMPVGGAVDAVLRALPGGS